MDSNVQDVASATQPNFITKKTPEPYFKAPNYILEDTELGDADKLVFMAIASFAGFSVIRPSIATIGKRCNLSERAVYRGISVLEKLGHVKRVAHGGNSGSTKLANVYEIETAHPDKLIRSIRNSTHPCPTVMGAPGAVDDLQSDHKHRTSMNECKNASIRVSKKKRTAKSSTRDLDLVQSILPWMEKVSACLGHARKLNGSESAKRTKDKIIAEEASVGAEVFRRAWLDYLAGGAWRDAKWPYSHFLASLKSRPDAGEGSPRKSRGGEKAPPADGMVRPTRDRHGNEQWPPYLTQDEEG